jgi:L-asparaginase
MDRSGKPHDPSAFVSLLKAQVPRMFEMADISFEQVCNKDSSNMAPRDWIELGRTIDRHLKSVNPPDGFVVIHGTDTMSFTASALSYMFSNLQVPIVFTGSQRPLADPQSDAPRNLLNAVQVASEGRVPEVSLFFDSLLIRGNRAKKLSIPSFTAFESPNHPPIARVGAHIEYAEVSRPWLQVGAAYTFDPRIETRVLSLALFPGIDPDLLYGAFREGTKGVILQAFGPGDIPIEDRSVAELIRRLVERGVPTVICSQAIFGFVDLSLYETGRVARQAGAFSALDMTWDAALVKLMVLLGRGYTMGSFEKTFQKSMAGELTERTR